MDRDGNVWVTDYQDNAPRPAGGARGRGGPVGIQAGATKGHQVIKFSPDGKVLMTLGDPGGSVDPQYFFQPNDVAVGRNGDIFVSQGHGQGKSELLKFSKDGKLIKRWGQTGTGPNEFDQPHALAFDSKGRLFVGDRNNNRIQILDQDGNFIEQWTQFSRPSGVFIDARDTIYVADSESESVARNHPGWKRGIRIGKVADGKVIAFIPDPNETATGTSAAEGVAADADGNVFGAVGPRAQKHQKKRHMSRITWRSAGSHRLGLWWCRWVVLSGQNRPAEHEERRLAIRPTSGQPLFAARRDQRDGFQEARGHGDSGPATSGPPGVQAEGARSS